MGTSILALTERMATAYHSTKVDVDTLFALGPKVGEISPIKGTTGLARAYETATHAQ